MVTKEGTVALNQQPPSSIRVDGHRSQIASSQTHQQIVATDGFFCVYLETPSLGSARVRTFSDLRLPIVRDVCHTLSPKLHDLSLPIAICFQELEGHLVLQQGILGPGLLN